MSRTYNEVLLAEQAAKIAAGDTHCWLCKGALTENGGHRWCKHCDEPEEEPCDV